MNTLRPAGILVKNFRAKIYGFKGLQAEQSTLFCDFYLGEFGGDEFRLDWALLKGVVILEWFGDVFGVFCCDQVNRPEREVVPV